MTDLNVFARHTKTNDPFEGIVMGDEVRDTLTGFKGIATGQCSHITGCDQILIQPIPDDPSTYQEARWFDVERVEVLTPAKAKVTTRLSGGVVPPARGGARQC